MGFANDIAERANTAHDLQSPVNKIGTLTAGTNLSLSTGQNDYEHTHRDAFSTKCAHWPEWSRLQISSTTVQLKTQTYEKKNPYSQINIWGRNSSLVVFGLAVHNVTGSILLWGNFPPKNSFGWEYKPRSSLCTHAFHRTDSKDPDVHVLDGWMPAAKTHPTCTIHEDGMWLP